MTRDLTFSPSADVEEYIDNLRGVRSQNSFEFDTYIQAVTDEAILQFFRMLASQSIPSWNQIIAWLREMESLRKSAD